MRFAHLHVQRDLMMFESIRLYSKSFLDTVQSLQTLLSIVFQFTRNVLHLVHLKLEARVFSLLSDVGLVDHVVEDGDLLLQVAPDVLTLSHRHLFYRFLLTLQNLNLLLASGYLSSESNDFVFDVVDVSLETKWLLGSQGSR